MEAYIHIVHVRTRVNSENQRPIMETLKKNPIFYVHYPKLLNLQTVIENKKL
jgi:hypothetical protein